MPFSFIPLPYWKLLPISTFNLWHGHSGHTGYYAYVYRDKYTGDVLVAWTNQYTAEENEVFDVANDPVNALLYPQVGLYAYYGSHTNFGVNVLLEYPNPLQPDQYGPFSSGELYIGAELFLHFTKVFVL